jgi:hypothetical protein
MSVSMFTMPGRNRKNRGPGRNGFQRAQTYDQSPNNHLRPPRPFGPTSQDGPRRRSHAQTHTPSSGIHRPNDNSNPGLSSRFRHLKQQSDVVKRELEDLISQIDELQPDAAAMDWSGSAGTIVYVPITCARDGSFQHAQMRSISTGEYPNGVATFLPYCETIHAGANNGNTPATPVAFTPYAESMRERTSSGTTISSTSRSSTVMPGEGSVPGSDVPISEYGRAHASNVRESVVRPPAAQGDIFRCGLPTLPSDSPIPPQLRGIGAGNMGGGQQHVSTYTTPEMSYREGGGSLGILNLNSDSNVEGQRTNQARSTTVASLLTPPPSPDEERGQRRYEGLGDVALQDGRQADGSGGRASMYVVR